MKGALGYGRYDDDPAHIGCPRAKSDMTPCIARDGKLALADDNECVGCGANPNVLLREVRQELGQGWSKGRPPRAAQDLKIAVLELTRDLL